MTTVLSAPTRIFAHRGFSSRQPEMTLAAYQEAIDWSLQEGVPLGLECDVRLTADAELVCLHDATLGRTSDAVGLVSNWTLAELRQLDFGSWWVQDPGPAQRALVTLAELLDLVRDARARGAEVSLAIETKHSLGGGLDVDQRVCALLHDYGWDTPDAPVRLITFSVAGARLQAVHAPDLERTLLVDKRLGPYAEGVLPDGIVVVGVDIDLLRQNPDFVAKARRRGNEVHAWTVNEPAEFEFCRDFGITGITTDCPDRALRLLRGPEPPEDTLVLLRGRRRRSRALAA
ncbi:MAG TPA: glycerophosphodiester phosphodiesterase family protein [Propionibacteriaceae bacterium]|nr:glycerophosphodiester phosphodiesterase family protein [Propionibacteriaceae bacterium]